MLNNQFGFATGFVRLYAERYEVVGNFFFQLRKHVQLTDKLRGKFQHALLLGHDMRFDNLVQIAFQNLLQ